MIITSLGAINFGGCGGGGVAGHGGGGMLWLGGKGRGGLNNALAARYAAVKNGHPSRGSFWLF